MEVRRRRVAKNKRKVVLRLLKLALFVLLGGTLIVGGVLFFQKRASNLVQPAAMGFSEGEQFVYTGTGFLYLKDSTLHYDDLYNDKNDSDYHFPISGEAVSLAGSSNIQLLYNSGYTKILDVPYEVQFEGTLVSLKCGLSHFATLVKDAQEVESLHVYDKNGTHKDRVEHKGQFILDYGFFSSSSEYLYVITVALDSGTPQSTISIYDMAAMTTTGVMHIQNQLIEQMRFTAGGIYAVGTSQIIRYSLSSNRESYSTMIYGWKALDFMDNAGPTFLLKPRRADTLGTVKLLTLNEGDVADTKERLLQMPQGTIDAFLLSGKLVAVTQAGYTAFGLDGKVSAERLFDSPIDTVEKLDSSTLLLSRQGTYYTIKIA